MADVAKNVIEFIQEAATLVGRVEAESFDQRMFGYCYNEISKSPIEQLFWVAVNAMAASLHIPIYEGYSERTRSPGVVVLPQFPIDQYRVDFLVAATNPVHADSKSVVVELDGHDFHDKDKRQRSYEKARDRHIQVAGYMVMHYTGSDIVRDPFGVAYDALKACGADVWRPYDKNNPMGLD